MGPDPAGRAALRAAPMRADRPPRDRRPVDAVPRRRGEPPEARGGGPSRLPDPGLRGRFRKPGLPPARAGARRHAGAGPRRRMAVSGRSPARRAELAARRDALRSRRAGRGLSADFDRRGHLRQPRPQPTLPRQPPRPHGVAELRDPRRRQRLDGRHARAPGSGRGRAIRGSARFSLPTTADTRREPTPASPQPGARP